MLPLVLPSSAMNMEVVMEVVMEVAMEVAIQVATQVALPVAFRAAFQGAFQGDFQAAFQAFQGMEGASQAGLKNQVNLLSLKSRVGPPGLMIPQNRPIL